MKVAFIHHAFPRIHNTFTVNEIVELLRRAVDVSLFSLGTFTEALKNDNSGEYGLPSRTFYFEDFPADDFSVPPSCEPFMNGFRLPARGRLRSLLTGQWLSRPKNRFSFAAVAKKLRD